jgi:predicted dehydrogenase
MKRTTTGLLTRRRFLAQAGGTLAACTVLPSTVLGRGGRAAPSERLGLAVIGLKKMGGPHVETLLGFPDVQVLAVCDVDTRVREATAKKVELHYAKQTRDGQYAGCAAYNEYERILERPDIDAVVIATPEHWHAIMAVDACRAGKDVYCEKPLALTVRDARAIANAARRYGTVFQTGTQRRAEGNFRFACELVRSGYIGDVKSVHVELGPCSRHVELPEEPVPPGFDYERWLGPAPWAPYNRLRVGSYYDDGWRRIRDYSGGKVTDWGAHYYDMVQWALGTDDSGPVEYIPPAPRQLDPEKAFKASDPRLHEGSGAVPEADPTWGLTMRYANGIEVVKDGRNGITFIGTKGRIDVGPGQLKTEPAALRTVKLGPNDVHLQVTAGHHQDWFECIRKRGTPLCPAEIGCRSVTMCHLGNIALWLNRTIRWDPVREEIIGDEYAARWLARPKRAPYRLNA